MKRALIIGGDSMIGAGLAMRLRAQGVQVDITSRRRGRSEAIMLDLASCPENWPPLPHADVAFLCAAITKMQTCEDNPDATARTNVIHMQTLATQLLAQGIYVVFLSTNQVFDGLTPYRSSAALTCPVNAYGKQKALFESWLLAQTDKTSVLRLTKVIGSEMPIIKSWSEALQQENIIEAFTDLVFAPLPLVSALDALEYLGNHTPQGIFHLSGLRDISYYEAACALAIRMGYDSSRVIATSARESGILPQLLPLHTTLESSQVFASIVCNDPMEALGTGTHSA